MVGFSDHSILCFFFNFLNSYFIDSCIDLFDDCQNWKCCIPKLVRLVIVSCFELVSFVSSGYAYFIGMTVLLARMYMKHT